MGAPCRAGAGAEAGTRRGGEDGTDKVAANFLVFSRGDSFVSLCGVSAWSCFCLRPFCFTLRFAS